MHTTSHPAAPTDAIRFRDALHFWLKLGFISFGGPAGQIAIMHQELVERRRWISEGRFLHALNYCMLLPGPEAQQLATYIGWLLHRAPGGIAAGVLFVLPSLLILIGLSWLYMALGNLPLVAGLFYGIKPAVTALVLQAAWRVGSRTLKHPGLWAIAACAFIAIAALSLPFPLIILLAALAGWLGGRFLPAVFKPATGGHAAGLGASAPALIDDHTPPPPHARFSVAGLAKVAVVGLILWLLPMGLLAAWQGWPHPFTQMGWFFTKAALLTFGGAYAVLPYVFQGAVGHYGWLNSGQMMDGLALGETTPGPLIMVVAFVGFVGGWQHAPLAGHAWLGASLAAFIATWFTFLPSFLFVLAGGPFIEHSHGKASLSAPLTGITAAVVGVIANLALFFGLHTLWPKGMGHEPDLWSILIMTAAGIALLRYKAGVIPVILVSAAAGALLTLTGWRIMPA